MTEESLYFSCQYCGAKAWKELWTRTVWANDRWEERPTQWQCVRVVFHANAYPLVYTFCSNYHRDKELE